MDRFDLEQVISSLYSTMDDLDLILEDVLEGEPSKDEIANAILGVKVLLQMKHKKIFDTFKAVFHLDEYSHNKTNIV